MSSLIDVYNGIIKYNNKDIVIVIDENIMIWFYAKQITDIFKYKNSNNIIKKFIDVTNKTTYDNIKEFSKYKYNIQDHSIFINEGGLYELILRSNKKEAIEFKKWITNYVIPSIRKIGKYDVDANTKKDIDILNKQLDDYKNKVKILENNQKIERYPKGGYIYILLNRQILMKIYTKSERLIKI